MDPLVVFEIAWHDLLDMLVMLALKIGVFVLAAMLLMLAAYGVLVIAQMVLSVWRGVAPHLWACGNWHRNKR